MEKNNEKFNPLDYGMGMTPFSHKTSPANNEKPKKKERKDNRSREFIPMGLTPFNNYNSLNTVDKIEHSESAGKQLQKCPECSETMIPDTDNNVLLKCSNCLKMIDVRNRKTHGNIDRSEYISESGLKLRDKINFKAVSYEISGRIRFRGENGEIYDKWQIVSKKGKKLWIEDLGEKIYFLRKLEVLKNEKEEFKKGDEKDFSGLKYFVSRIRTFETEYIEGEIDTELFAGDKIKIIEFREGRKRNICENNLNNKTISYLKQIPGGKRTMFRKSDVDKKKSKLQNKVIKKKRSKKMFLKNFFQFMILLTLKK